MKELTIEDTLPDVEMIKDVFAPIGQSTVSNKISFVFFVIFLSFLTRLDRKYK
jgi:hypothetical protein